MSYGKKVGSAIQAVIQMHRDTVQLLNACASTIGSGKVDVFRNQITRGMSQVATAQYHMAEGMFKYYRTREKPELVEGVTAVFHEKISPFDEPTFIAGQLKYHAGHGPEYNRAWGGWDLWFAFFCWGDAPALNQIIKIRPSSQATDEDGKERIEHVTLIAKPLYSIQNISDVEAMLERTRNSA